MKVGILVLFVSTAAGLAVARLPSVGPDYVKPTLDVPAEFHDAVPWRTAAPADERVRGDWWTVFGDPTLDDLERRALEQNQDLRAASARVDQAFAIAGAARAAYWPEVQLAAGVARERTSRSTDNRLPVAPTTTYQLPLFASWEIDFFGRTRRLHESARDEALAVGAGFEAARLALTAEVATTYFSYAATVAEYELVNRTVALRRRAVDLVAARVRSGTAADVDAARAETELAIAEAELADLGNRRDTLAHGLNVLVGEPAVRAPVAAVLPRAVPSVPAGLPAQVLEQRPDVAAAERRLAAANARIGVAKAAFFPSISLTGSAGYASGDIDRLFTADSRVWSIGPQLYLPIFQGGRNRANLQRSRAAYDEAVALFRQQVLVAFREVQDALTATRWLAEQESAQSRAVGAAQRTVELAQRRYDSGYVAYLEVIDAQRTALGTQRAATQLRAQRLNASIALIRALGGGWQNQQVQLASLDR